MSDTETSAEPIKALIKAGVGDFLKSTENQAIVVEWFKVEA